MAALISESSYLASAVSFVTLAYCDGKRVVQREKQVRRMDEVVRRGEGNGRGEFGGEV